MDQSIPTPQNVMPSQSDQLSTTETAHTLAPSSESMGETPPSATPAVADDGAAAAIEGRALKTLIEQCHSARLMIDTILAGLEQLPSLLPSFDGSHRVDHSHSHDPAHGSERIIEGVFNGQGMVGTDGATYPVPPNYASKSKLVEGDRLKLTITPIGTFIYKQIAPVERQRDVGILHQSPDGGHEVEVGGRRLRVLTASITYYRGREGDEVVVLIPRDRPTHWATVDNVMSRGAIIASSSKAFHPSSPDLPPEDILKDIAPDS